jgi:hypothetical protein
MYSSIEQAAGTGSSETNPVDSAISLQLSFVAVFGTALITFLI